MLKQSQQEELTPAQELTIAKALAFDYLVYLSRLQPYKIERMGYTSLEQALVSNLIISEDRLRNLALLLASKASKASKESKVTNAKT